MEKKCEKKEKAEEYPTADWATLEHLAASRCPCCGQPGSAEDKPALTARCHLGPAFFAYWDGFIYMDCHKCHKPICRIPVDRSLLKAPPGRLPKKAVDRSVKKM